MSISVIIPTLNERESLPNCLSLLEPQVGGDDEIIVVDGGSDDGTIEIAEEYCDKVVITDGAGIGASRNIGAKEASCGVIATTDADGIPPHDWLSKIRSNFSNDPELTVLWGDIQDKNGVPIRNLVGKFSTLLGGASGNNTAFRRSKFEELENGYPDIDFMEDVFIIGKLASIGKAKRDPELLMVMDMDRRRYQTGPLLAASAAGIAAGSMIGDMPGRLVKGASIGLSGTELFYEGFTGTDLHHDQTGAGVVAMGNMLEDDVGEYMSGGGLGMILHHAITEGISALPTELYENTDIEEVREVVE